MGAMPRLKKKDEFHYRKGSTDESQNCRYCKNFREDFPLFGIGGNGGKPRKIESRCVFMGLAESVRYRVRFDYTCDSQVKDKEKLPYRGGVKQGTHRGTYERR
jgi:hypothetical protein